MNMLLAALGFGPLPRDAVLFELDPDLAERCWQFGLVLAKDYERKGRTELSMLGIETDPRKLAEAKAGECVAALHLGLDPNVVILWSVGVPEGGDDMLAGRTLLDTKNTQPRYEYLFWPIAKNHIFWKKNFHVLVLTKACLVLADDRSVAIAAGHCVGWLGKKEFWARHRTAPEGLRPGCEHHLLPGTWYVHQERIHRMGTFPGRPCDDPRETYCWCGEWGSHPGHLCAEHRNRDVPKPPPPPSKPPPPPSPGQRDLFA